MAERNPDVEAKMTRTMIRNLSNTDQQVRKKMLDMVVVMAFDPARHPGFFVEAGGIPPLLERFGEQDQILRHHAVEAVDRLAELGFAEELERAGALSSLGHLEDDPWPPIRKVAKRAAERILKKGR